MNTLQQVIKQRSDEFEKRLSNHNDDEVYSDANWGCMECGGGLKEEFVKSHNQETVVAILEAVQNECVQIKDMKVDGDDLWVKIPATESKIIRLIPAEVIDSILQDIKNNKQ